jgi:hypothetical protein
MDVFDSRFPRVLAPAALAWRSLFCGKNAHCAFFPQNKLLSRAAEPRQEYKLFSVKCALHNFPQNKLLPPAAELHQEYKLFGVKCALHIFFTK